LFLKGGRRRRSEPKQLGSFFLGINGCGVQNGRVRDSLVGEELDISELEQTGENGKDPLLVGSGNANDAQRLDDVLELSGVVQVLNFKAARVGQEGIALRSSKVKFLRGRRKKNEPGTSSVSERIRSTPSSGHQRLPSGAGRRCGSSFLPFLGPPDGTSQEGMSRSRRQPSWSCCQSEAL